MSIYLEFEESIKELEEQLEKNKTLKEKGVDTLSIDKEIKRKIRDTKKKIYSSLSPWQKVMVSRHPERPYTMAYIENLTSGNFIELHGDRNIGDDKAMVGGFGMLEKQSFLFVGHQKGINTKMRQYRNFGMANPEGYRKALRLMKLAEKFNKPIISFVDTPGAFPGIEAEERGQGEAIAKNLFEMARLKVPIIVIIIGEGASGGALGIGLGDKILMLEHTWYSVISPENCSTILWRSRDFKEQAAESLKLTAQDMLKNNLIDKIIKEPIGGAHSDPQKIFETVKKELLNQLKEFKKIKPSDLVKQRIKKFSNMGEIEIK